MMDSISGFSFIHNGIEGGYPFKEAIAAIKDYVNSIYIVDMQSTDGTREVLESLDKVTVIDGLWGTKAGETLKRAHALHTLCEEDVIWHFEADEVYDEELCISISDCIKHGLTNLSVYRLQIEQNFQRVRWYPEPVHRIFPNYTEIEKEGHTTKQHAHSLTLPVADGLLWDCTNCFRDNWLTRVYNQAELWGTQPQYIMTGLHVLHPVDISEEEVMKKFHEPHWEWEQTPLAIPEILRPLVGKTIYEP